MVHDEYTSFDYIDLSATASDNQQFYFSNSYKKLLIRL